MKHTPGPWKITKNEHTGFVFIGKDNGNNYPLYRESNSFAKGKTMERAEQDAACIIRALNCHDELLEACNAALNDWHAKPSNINKKEPKYLAILRAAIAKAEKGE